MRLYNLSDSTYGPLNAENGHLKVSRIDDLNDPFELRAVDLRDPRVRAAFQEARRRVTENYGVVCLTETWKNPVMWSHYGDKHKGVCLGFDAADDLAESVSYQHLVTKLSKREKSPECDLTELLVKRLLRVKFADWRYEQERRIVVELAGAQKENGLYFYPMSECLVLQEIWLGARCELDIGELRSRFAGTGGVVRIRKARIAFTKFSIVEDRRFRNPIRSTKARAVSHN